MASCASPAEHPVGALRKLKPASSSCADTMASWRRYRDQTRRSVLSTYTIMGFLSSGTYGRVYKACLKHPEESFTSRTSTPTSATTPGPAPPLSSRVRPNQRGKNTREEDTDGGVFAIKKFKSDKENDVPGYTGISQSAMREIALNRELRHENVVTLREVLLEHKSIYMVFSYASHDFLQLIHHHATILRNPLPLPLLKSLLFQLLSGVHYLHSNWVLHRDLKPANILLTSSGVVKIGDLGLARLYNQPLQPLYNGDKVVVTIWYRAPELLMGTRHYTPAIDIWAVGCIWGELLSLRPLFKGDEAKVDNKSKVSVLQTDQMGKIIDVLGKPTKEKWPDIEMMPDWKGYHQTMRLGTDTRTNNLSTWYHSFHHSLSGLPLLSSLLQYDPLQRLTAHEALLHPWFHTQDPIPTANAFHTLPRGQSVYPSRRLHSDTTDPVMAVDPSRVVVPENFRSAVASGVAPPAGGSTSHLGGNVGALAQGGQGGSALHVNHHLDPTTALGNINTIAAGGPGTSNLLLASGPAAPAPAPSSVPPSLPGSVPPSAHWGSGQAGLYGEGGGGGASGSGSAAGRGGKVGGAGVGGGGGEKGMLATAAMNAAIALQKERESKRAKIG